VNLEDAVSVLGVDVGFADAVRDAERARERPVSALEPIEPVLRLLLRSLALAGDGQRAFVELDRDLVLGMPGRSSA
jgi:hypothetical protein